MMKKGFTLIELLIVIAVLGILAVAVLAAINPIEQINRSRDTGSRSDAEQLLGAVDRFYASRGFYPWRSSPTLGTDALAFTRVIAMNAWQDNAAENVLEKLSGAAASTLGTSELKSSFVERVVATGYNYLWVYNGGEAIDSTYICFNGKSQSFQQEAKDRCDGTIGTLPADLAGISTNICNITVDSKTGQYLSCLP